VLVISSAGVWALPHADNALLTLEHASDAELRAAADQHRRIRQAELDNHSQLQ
jgi:hypothetical protein